MYYVIKATGEREPFNEEKVRGSIHRAGIPDELQNQVIEHIKSKLYDNIHTSEVYHHITEFLGASQHPYTSSKYSLKRAVMELGPTGFPFEDFIARLLQTEGYTTQVRTISSGKCITHEIDVIASRAEQNRTEKMMVEAKFHNMPGTKTNVHVALYTKARFDDVKEKNDFTRGMLITNTHISTDAITYGICADLKIISWNYPDGGSLRDIIEKSGLIPITTLATLSYNQKQLLLKNQIVTSKDIIAKPDSLRILNVQKNKIEKIIAEAEFVSKERK